MVFWGGRRVDGVVMMRGIMPNTGSYGEGGEGY